MAGITRGLIVLGFAALLAPATAGAHDGRAPAGASQLAASPALIHGIAGDGRYVFDTEPGIGVSTAGPRVVVRDRRTGAELGALPAPPGGWGLPFTLRVPRPGHLIVLDSSGFPPQGPPKVYDYAYTSRGGFHAALVRTTDFAGLPLAFAEDVEALPNGDEVVSESVIGGLWIIGRDGVIRPGLVPSGAAPLPKLGPCGFPAGTFTVGDLPFAGPGGFAPGAGSLAVRGGDLYVSSTCEGGILRVPLRLLYDTSRTAEARAADIQVVTPRVYPLESLKGIQFDPYDPSDPWIYAGDPFRLQLIRVNSRTGERQVLSTDHRLFNFTTSTAWLPPARRGGPPVLVTASDQEYRWSGLNSALTADAFQPPFIIAQYAAAGRSQPAFHGRSGGRFGRGRAHARR
jgi:hypothetical protein